MDNFTIANFLRAIGKGPDECPEWWGWANTQGQYLKKYERHIRKPDPLWNCTAPFADILDNWTRDKDALLLGVGLEYVRGGDFQRMYDVGLAALPTLLQSKYEQSTSATLGIGIAVLNPNPGLTLARAIYAAIGGGK